MHTDRTRTQQPTSDALTASGTRERRRAAAPAATRGTHREEAETAALARIFDGHYARLLGLAHTLGAGEEAEDMVAEAFCQLHRRRGELRAADAAVGYLRSIVRNQVRMRIRHETVVRRHARSTAGAPEVVHSAEQAALHREDRRALLAALARLPERQREAIVLRYWAGLKDGEIADRMGVSTGSVKAHTFRALTALRDGWHAADG